MIVVRLAALALGLAVAATASPSFAQKSKPRPPTDTLDARAQALRDCSNAAVKFPELTWGIWEVQIYRACMAQRGQRE